MKYEHPIYGQVKTNQWLPVRSMIKHEIKIYDLYEIMFKNNETPEFIIRHKEIKKPLKINKSIGLSFNKKIIQNTITHIIFLSAFPNINPKSNEKIGYIDNDSNNIGLCNLELKLYVRKLEKTKHKEIIKKNKKINFEKNKNNIDWVFNYFSSQYYNKEISCEEIKQKYNSSDGKCYYCGINLVYNEKNNKNDAVVLDRIDNANKSHDFSNVLPCCHLCNNMRSNLKIEIFENIIQVLNGESNILDLSTYATQIERSDASNSSRNYNDSYPIDERKNIFLKKYEKQNKRCALSQLPFVIISSSRSELAFSNPSVDRIDSTKNGVKLKHTKENTHLVWNLFNRAKNDYSMSEFTEIMNSRFEKWSNGYADVEIIYPDNHYKNWLEGYEYKNETYHWVRGYESKNEIYYDEYNMNTIKNMEKFIKIHSRKPKASNSIEEKTLLSAWVRLNRPGAKDRGGKKCFSELIRFKKTPEYKLYLCTNEEKIKNLLEDHKQFCLDNDRLPSTGENMDDAERRLAKKFCDHRRKVLKNILNIYNNHYQYLRDYIQSDEYKKYYT